MSVAYDQAMVEIEMRRRDGSVKAVALIDDEDAAMVLTYRWALDSQGYVRRYFKTDDGRTASVSLHRQILGLERGDPREVDHINLQPLDNRRANLRACTRAQNRQNRATAGNRGSVSRFRGVVWDRSRGRWKAQARLGGRQYNLGRFDDEEHAARVAAAWRAEHMPFSADAQAA